MTKKFVWQGIAAVLCIGLCSLCIRDFVGAQGASSSYRINESYFGPGGQLNSNSTNYQTDPGQQAVGGTGGSGTSTNYTVQSGSVTASEPRLLCALNTASINFGSLSTSLPATGTATFSVLNYTAYGYIVSIIGSPPSNSGHALTNLASNASSTPGTEQFGINLVDNSTPNVGTNPVQVPDNTFSFGEIATNYDTVNSFRYAQGETIASGPKSSGQTDFTISYLINASTTTPGGKYSGNQTIVCTGRY